MNKLPQIVAMMQWFGRFETREDWVYDFVKNGTKIAYKLNS
jgi:hypothetical protein